MNTYIKYILKDTAAEAAFTLLIAGFTLLAAMHNLWWLTALAATVITASIITIRQETRKQ